MSTDEQKTNAPAPVQLAAWMSLVAPVAMVFLAALLPKDDRPLHPSDNQWYCYLTVMVCFISFVSACWSLVNRSKNPAQILVIATFGIIASVLIGFVAFLLASIQGMHT